MPKQISAELDKFMDEKKHEVNTKTLERYKQNSEPQRAFFGNVSDTG